MSAFCDVGVHEIRGRLRWGPYSKGILLVARLFWGSRVFGKPPCVLSIVFLMHVVEKSEDLKICFGEVS